MLRKKSDKFLLRWSHIMNHDSGFIIGIAMVFAKTLIEHTPKSIHHLKITLKFFFTMILGPLVSIK